MAKNRDSVQLYIAIIFIILISYGITNYIQSYRVYTPRIYEYRVILSENFESTGDDSLPLDFIHSGNSKDEAYVTTEIAMTGRKSLYIHEHGGDDKNSLVKIYDIDAKNIILDFYYMINGYSACRQVFQFYNEDDEPCVGMNTRIGDPWRYKTSVTGSKGTIPWLSIPEFDSVECDRWYHIQIYVDYESQMVVYRVDGAYSEWLPSQRPWSQITAISFRGNLNYPSDAWYDDIHVIEYYSN